MPSLKELEVLATLVDCKDCGSRPEIKEYINGYKMYYITCPNKKCKIRQSTPERNTLEEAADIWNRNHKRKQ